MTKEVSTWYTLGNLMKLYTKYQTIPIRIEPTRNVTDLFGSYI